MTTYRVEIESLSAFAEAVNQLAEDWEDIMADCMIAALLRTGYLDEVWRRTPKSSRDRYASARDSSILQSYTDDKGLHTKLREGWKDKLAAKGISDAAMTRIMEYGMDRLASSLIPDGNVDKTSDIFTIRSTGRAVELSISSSVEYAAAIHEAEKPVEGDYWEPGKKEGWSARGTGNKYLERPYEELQDRILAEFVNRFDDELRRRGLL